MRYKQLVKMLRKHPYLLEPCVTISLNDALKEIEAYTLPTFEQIVATAKRRADLPAEAWAPAERAIAKQNKRIGSKWQIPVPYIRRGVIVAIVVGILAFFTLVPIGRTWAAEAWNFIIRIFDGRIEIEHSDDIGQMEDTTDEVLPPEAIAADMTNESESNVIYYDNLSEFEDITGKNPVALESSEIQLEFAYSVEDVFDFTLCTMYKTASGLELQLVQTWSNTSQITYATDKLWDWSEYRISDDCTLYYGINPEHNLFEGVVVLSDSHVMISCDSSFDVEWVANAIVIS